MVKNDEGRERKIALMMIIVMREKIKDDGEDDEEEEGSRMYLNKFDR